MNFSGVEKCQQPERERLKVEHLLSSVSLVSFDSPAARRAATVRADLEQIGKACGPYDMLLAGHALSLGLSLATNNVGKFSRISSLTIEDWLA